MRSLGSQSGRLALVLLAMAALASGGCATAGFMVAGPLFQAAVALADRTVERTLPADRATGWSATTDALSRMGFRIHDVKRSGEEWSLKGTGDKVSVSVGLAPVTSRMSRLSLRVEAGGITADKKTADEIFNQVGATLTAWASPASGSAEVSADRKAATEAIVSLKREVERLGTRMEQPRDPQLAPDSGSTPVKPALVDTGGIVVVPTALAVPSAPAPERPTLQPDRPSATRSAPAESSVIRTTTSTGGGAQALASRPENENLAVELDILPAPLSPVEPLRPVDALGTKRSAQ
jgi:hypothetical protein